VGVEEHQDTGSVYIFHFDGTDWMETKLRSSDAATDDAFGYSVSLDGDRLVAGARNDDDSALNSGSIYIYDYDGTSWNETKLIASDPGKISHFGESVAVDGNRIIVGAAFDDNANGGNPNNSLDGPGAAYIFDYDGTSWNETKLIASDGAEGDQFGGTVSVSGDRVAVAAEQDDNANGGSPNSSFDGAGAVYVYDFDGASWNETKFISSDGASGDQYGQGLSLDQDRLVVGASRADNMNGNAAGAVYVYDFDGTGWNDTTKLIAPDGGASHLFGISVSAQGDRVAIGASFGDGNASNAGSVYLLDQGATSSRLRGAAASQSPVIWGYQRQVTVEFAPQAGPQAQVSVYNLAGQQVATARPQPKQARLQLQLDQLPQGVYIVRVSGPQPATKKILLR
jgi:hypothetical protein